MYVQEDSPHPLINCTWYANAEHDGVYTDPANEYWSMAFVKRSDKSSGVEVYGPSLRPRILEGFAGEEYWGVEFKAHATLIAISKGELLNADISLPVVDTSFLIGVQCYQIPTYKKLEHFVQQLQEDGIVIADSRIERALQGSDAGLSQRSRQRHVKNVTGLTKKQIEQLKRARHAYYLIQTGHSLPDAAITAGYADQPHMTRSLKLLRGETPTQIIAAHLDQS